MEERMVEREHKGRIYDKCGEVGDCKKNADFVMFYRFMRGRYAVEHSIC